MVLLFVGVRALVQTEAENKRRGEDEKGDADRAAGNLKVRDAVSGLRRQGSTAVRRLGHEPLPLLV